MAGRKDGGKAYVTRKFKDFADEKGIEALNIYIRKNNGRE